MTTTLRANKYAGSCVDCKGHVAEAAGSLDKVNNKWVVRHLAGECKPAAPQAKVTTFVKGSKINSLPLGEKGRSNFAITLDGELIFVAVIAFQPDDKPAGHLVRYVRQLIGAPGSWKKIKPSSARRDAIIDAIYADPTAALVLYGREFVQCGMCQSPLSKDESRERGIGPVCFGRLG